MASPRLNMPGSFLYENAMDEKTLPPKLDLNVGSKSQIYQPPRTPSASTSLYRSTSSMSASSASGMSSVSRKRTRNEFVQDSADAADWRHLENRTASESTGRISVSQAQASGLESPEPFVNTRYELSGGLDTPTTEAVAAYERENGDSNYFDTMDRRWAGARRDSDLSYSRVTTPGTERESNIRGQSDYSGRNLSNPGWGKSVFDMMGEVAGKVWQFGASAFTGFSAGGGAGYQLPRAQLSSIDQTLRIQDPAQMSMTGSWSIPGEFPAEDYIPDYMSSPHLGQHSAKRIHRDSGAWEAADRWVLVPRSASIPRSRDSSPFHTTPVRRTPVASSVGRRPAPRSGRRNPRTSTAGSPALSSHRPASYASPRSSLSTPASKNASPAAVEAQRYAARRRREDKEAEASIQKFNAQLKAMIREGKQALGTRFEVDGDDEFMEDEGEVTTKAEDVEDEGIQIDEVYERGKRRR